ncbi:MAG: hypothetical protein IPO66_12590 [Rhodanobacteraceae bacterium]|nr:hypothetical protein [Rhodanobacteraceae bacterium]
MINDDELLLYHYQDGLEAARMEAIGRLLRSDPDLARRYQQLRAELAQIPAPAEMQPSAAAQDRWRLRLQQRAGTELPTHPPRRHWTMTLAGATLVLLGVAIGTRIAERSAPVTEIPIAATADPLPLQRGLRSHFRDARAVLAQLPLDDPAQRSALVNDIVAQNRLYERAALAQGDERLARVLRAFEPVLAELAKEPVPGESDSGARAQLDFELAVMQTKMSRSPSKIVQSL